MADEKPSKRVRIDDCPPVFTSLEGFSQGSEANRQRCESLVAKFREKYGREPHFLARAPGRVNIIGEHIDYSGYAVLPMALENDITIACRLNGLNSINFSNVDVETYPDYSCPAAGFGIDSHSWYHYFLCGVKGVVEKACVQNPVGMDVLLDGTIPPNAGLSSSSALVCCSALVALQANKMELPPKRDLAELCAKSERYIGTEGGGMDQAISFLGEPGKAKMIEFNPIRLTDVKLPSGTCFVISNTLVQENKAAPASFFNERVAECRLAAQVIAKMKGKNWRQIRKFHHLQDSLGFDLDKMASIVSECLHPESYTREEISKLLEVSDEELESTCLSEKTKSMQQFMLHNRAKHVFQEAKRVISFKDIANSGEDQDPIAMATTLGALMDNSHKSCSELYECSCRELDQLVSLCKSSGALGSRLTGAGWGGCAVSLVQEDMVKDFMTKVTAGYYEANPTRKAALTQALFATKPGPGAALCEC